MPDFAEEEKLAQLSGSGGGGGKGGGDRKPKEEKDNLFSRAEATVLVAVAEGPVEGFAESEKQSVYLNDTPIENEKGDNKAVFTLRLEASSSHQERTCEVMLSVQSEGDNAQRSSTFNMAVSAPSTEETNTPDQSDDDDAPILSDSSSLPWLSMTEMLVVFFLAMMALRRGPL